MATRIKKIVDEGIAVFNAASEVYDQNWSLQTESVNGQFNDKKSANDAARAAKL